MVTLDSRPQQAERVLMRRVTGTMVLLDLRKGHYYALNEVGRTVWELCDGTRTVSDVVSAVCDEYSVPREVGEADVLELLQDMAGEKLMAVR